MAGAYGGVAHPKPKRTGYKYTTDLDAGLRDIATPGIIKDGILRESNAPVNASRKQLQYTSSGLEAEGYQHSDGRPFSKAT